MSRAVRIILGLSFVLSCAAFGVASALSEPSVRGRISEIDLPGILIVALFGASAAIFLPGLGAYGRYLVILAGLLLVGQSLLAPWLSSLVGGDFKTRGANQHQRFVIDAEWMPGVSGEKSLTTDREGFRVTLPIDYEHKPEAAYRVFTIGGSTTEEAYLSDRETWSHRLQVGLQRRLPERRVEVINTGVAGLRARHHLATLRAIEPYHPDLAVFLLGGNDWNRYAARRLGPSSLRSPLVRPHLFRSSPVYRLAARLARTLSRPVRDTPDEGEPDLNPSFFYRRQLRVVERPEVRSFHPDEVSEEFREGLLRILAECNRQGIDCLLVNQPTALQPGLEPELEGLFWMSPPKERYRVDLASMRRVAALYNRRILAEAAAAGQRSCDVGDRLPPTTDFFFDEMHLTERGSALLAGMILGCLDIHIARLLDA